MMVFLSSRQIQLLTVLTACLLMAVGAGAQDVEQQNRAKELYNQGVTAMQSGDVATAVTSFQGAIAADPNYADAYVNLGAIHFERKAYDEARNSFTTATEKDPKNADAFANLGKVEYKTKRYAQAQTALESALALKAGDATILKELGKTFYAQKNYAQTVAILDQCHNAGGGDHITWYMLGKAHQKQGKNSNAITALKKCIAIKSSYYNGRTALGAIYLSQEKFNQAAAEFAVAKKDKKRGYKAAYNYAVAVESADPDAIDKNISNWEAYVAKAKGNPKARNDVNVAEQHVKDLKARKEKLNLQ